MKDVTDFRKTVETGVDPHLLMMCYSTEMLLKIILRALKNGSK